MTVVNPDKVAEILAECADRFILPRYKKLEDHEISSKTSPRDLVTQADIETEAYLERVLVDLVPGSIVVGEEGVSRGEMDMDVLKDTSQKIWVVDPVDGTHNFVHHKREFGILLSLTIGGETVVSWVYDILGEAFAITERGSGAFFDGRRMRVDQVEPAPENLTGFINPRFFPEKYRDHIEAAGEPFKSASSLHCAAHEYLNIARGDAHFVLYNRLKPWDNLAGALMVEEAGGYVAKWDGTPYEPHDYHCGIIVATNQDNWQIVHDAFLKSVLDAG